MSGMLKISRSFAAERYMTFCQAEGEPNTNDMAPPNLVLDQIYNLAANVRH